MAHDDRERRLENARAVFRRLWNGGVGRLACASREMSDGDYDGEALIRISAERVDRDIEQMRRASGKPHIRPRARTARS